MIKNIFLSSREGIPLLQHKNSSLRAKITKPTESDTPKIEMTVQAIIEGKLSFDKLFNVSLMGEYLILENSQTPEPEYEVSIDLMLLVPREDEKEFILRDQRCQLTFRGSEYTSL